MAELKKLFVLVNADGSFKGDIFPAFLNRTNAEAELKKESGMIQVFQELDPSAAQQQPIEDHPLAPQDADPDVDTDDDDSCDTTDDDNVSNPDDVGDGGQPDGSGDDADSPDVQEADPDPSLFPPSDDDEVSSDDSDDSKVPTFEGPLL